MATPAQIRAVVDARLAAVWPNLVARQNTYLAAKGRYWQGIRTHANLPADGDSPAADQLTAKPSYQAEDWAAFGVPSWTEQFALEVHQYNGPSGKGWVAFAHVMLGGRTFLRAKGQGPENRDSPWMDVTPVPDAGG